MKKMLASIIHLFLLFFSLSVVAQQKISIDIAAVRNIRHQLNGLNVSSFYHFNERITGGLEVNRFFPKNHQAGEENIQLSAWDIDINFHYSIPLTKIIKLYPITGISHTSEKEMNGSTKETKYERLWSYNAGGGILWETGRWAPHVEYLFTWGHINQQFLLAGISYELNLGKQQRKEK
jgi:hypothetical protein